METNGLISAAEASAALTSAKQTRARVAWTGYPAWYWLTTAAGLATTPFVVLLPDWWDLAAGLPLVALLFLVAVRASRVRGVCEGWTGTAMRWWEMGLLYGPPVVLIFANAVVYRFALWSPILAAAATAVLIFALFAGTARRLSARATRP
ncbi:MAG TPA: hypothetical protein VGL06_23925 [Pseudonocardiaceae bacterium]